MNEYYVYKWYIKDTNEVFYIGKGKGKRYKTIRGRNKFFLDIYNTYNCTSEIIFDNLTEKEAFKKEIELIAYYRQIPNNILTNITNGGEGSSGYVPSEESKQKASESSKRKWKDPVYRQHMIDVRNAEDSVYKSQEFRDKISSLVKGKNNPNYNHKWSDDQKQHLSSVRKNLGLAKGLNNPKATKIICLETGEVFDLIIDALQKYDIKSEGSMSVALKYPQKTAAGLHWRYFDEKLLDADYRFHELLVSHSISRYKSLLCLDDKKIYRHLKPFLKEKRLHIKKFNQLYDKKIIIDNKTYMFITDYLSRTSE